MSYEELEEGSNLQLDFTKLAKATACGEDLVPAVAQDADTGEVLIVGYANRLALETSLKEGKATFWSTSRNELWIKGATSGDYLESSKCWSTASKTRFSTACARPEKAPATPKDPMGEPARAAIIAKSSPMGSWSIFDRELLVRKKVFIQLSLIAKTHNSLLAKSFHHFH